MDRIQHWPVMWQWSRPLSQRKPRPQVDLDEVMLTFVVHQHLGQVPEDLQNFLQFVTASRRCLCGTVLPHYFSIPTALCMKTFWGGTWSLVPTNDSGSSIVTPGLRLKRYRIFRMCLFVGERAFAPTTGAGAFSPLSRLCVSQYYVKLEVSLNTPLCPRGLNYSILLLKKAISCLCA